MKHTVIGVVVLSLVCEAAVATEYKASELQSMIAEGRAPDTLPPTTETQEAKFPMCRAMVNGLVGALTRNIYPTVLVADNARIYAKTLWLNDESMALTCSSSDDKLTTVRSKYK